MLEAATSVTTCEADSPVPRARTDAEPSEVRPVTKSSDVVVTPVATDFVVDETPVTIEVGVVFPEIARTLDVLLVETPVTTLEGAVAFAPRARTVAVSLALTLVTK